MNEKVNNHMEICKQLNDVYAAKNADYGDSFADMYQELGIITAITRIGDKFNRLKNITVKSNIEVKEETVADTLLDMANYCIMTVMELQEKS